MKKLNFILILNLILFITGCLKQERPTTHYNSNNYSSSILEFNSIEHLQQTIDNLSEDATFPTTKSQNFISLWEYKKDSVLNSLTEEELNYIKQEELTFEPEDDILIDPRLLKIVNKNREVKIKNKIYRFISEGLIIYPENISFNSIDTNSFHLNSIKNGETINFKNFSFTRINYSKATKEHNLATKANAYLKSHLTFIDGGTVPQEDIHYIPYKKGEGDANGFQKMVSGAFGVNVVAENYFDKQHRMKLRVFTQDYGLYRSVGMTVRMQKRVLGIWWRKKAQEFRYGCSAIECRYEYDKPVLYTGEFAPFPIIVPFTETYNRPVIIYNIPLRNYNINNDVTEVLNDLLIKYDDEIDAAVKDWKINEINSFHRGFATIESEKTSRAIFPQLENNSFGEGREIVRWEFEWFHKPFIVSYKSNLAGKNSYGIQGLPPYINNEPILKRITIERVYIYGATRFNNRWKACVIKTE